MQRRCWAVPRPYRRRSKTRLRYESRSEACSTPLWIRTRVCTFSHLPRLGPVHVWTLNGSTAVETAPSFAAHTAVQCIDSRANQQPEFTVQCIIREETSLVLCTVTVIR